MSRGGQKEYLKQTEGSDDAEKSSWSSRIFKYWKPYFVVALIGVLGVSIYLSSCPLLPYLTESDCSFWDSEPEKPDPFDLVIVIHGSENIDRYEKRYTCTLEGSPPYLRPNNRFRCIAKNNPTLELDRNLSANINVSWVQTNGGNNYKPQYSLVSDLNDGNSSELTEEFYINTPPTNGRYKFSIPKTSNEEFEIQEAPSNRRYKVYSSSEVLQYQNKQFRQRTLPIQLLILILVIFEGFQLLLSAFSYLE